MPWRFEMHVPQILCHVFFLDYQVLGCFGSADSGVTW